MTRAWRSVLEHAQISMCFPLVVEPYYSTLLCTIRDRTSPTAMQSRQCRSLRLYSVNVGKLWGTLETLLDAENKPIPSMPAQQQPITTKVDRKPEEARLTSLPR